MQSRLPPVPHDANDESHIDDILDWLNGKSVANDYFNAVREVLSSDIVSPRDVGLVTSAVGVYLRDQQEQDHPEVEGAWIGSTGDLVEIKLVVTGERAVQTIFGPRHLTKLRTSDGDRVKWWGNGPTGLVQGDVVFAKGMVGECQVWANRRETTLKYAEWVVNEHATSPTSQDHDDSLY
jgi:hypothetical protein